MIVGGSFADRAAVIAAGDQMVKPACDIDAGVSGHGGADSTADSRRGQTNHNIAGLTPACQLLLRAQAHWALGNDELALADEETAKKKPSRRARSIYIENTIT